MPEIVLLLIRLGILALLWLFVLFAVLAIRRDLAGPKAAVAAGAPKQKPAKQPRGSKRSQARQLVVTEGALAGTKVALRGDPVTIGRANDSTLVLSDDYASTRHARLVPRGDSWLVEDLGSTNGTYLDRTKVTAPTPVPLGVPIRIGKTVLMLRK
jgi:pSer/pThr/pTyr-binding forkhead associated (FHA) protein